MEEEEKSEIIKEFILTEENYIKELECMKKFYKSLVEIEPIFKDLFSNLDSIIATHEPFLLETKRFFNKRSSKSLIDVFLILQKSQKTYQTYSSKYKKYHMLFSCLSIDKEHSDTITVSFIFYLFF